MATLKHEDYVTDLVINKLTRQQYNELSSKLNPYELYMIEDVDFDVFDRKIVHVLNPVDDNDAVNKIYMVNNCVLTSNAVEYVDKNAFRIKSTDGNTMLSADNSIYERKWGTNDWRVQVLLGDDVVQPSDVSFSYQEESGEGRGWIVTIKGSVVKTGVTDKKVEELFAQTTVSGKTVRIRATRDCWTKTDELVRKSQVYSSLSGITSSSDLDYVRNCLIDLASKMNVVRTDMVDDLL